MFEKSTYQETMGSWRLCCLVQRQSLVHICYVSPAVTAGLSCIAMPTTGCNSICDIYLCSFHVSALQQAKAMQVLSRWPTDWAENIPGKCLSSNTRELVPRSPIFVTLCPKVAPGCTVLARHRWQRMALQSLKMLSTLFDRENEATCI